METPEKHCLASPILGCTIVLEELNPQGTIRKSTNLKSVKLLLGRNEFRDILLQIEAPKKSYRYTASNFVLYKNFWKDGKATIHLKDCMIKILIANAPPNILLNLLKILNAKTDLNSNKENKLSFKQKFLSSLPKEFDEISPMTAKEYETLRSRKGILASKSSDLNIPWSSPLSSKRKKCNDSKNDQQVGPPKKIARFLNPITLNKDQRRVISVVQSGRNVFFTGSAGTGKSFLLKRVVGLLPPDVTAVTASTGIAACHIGGTTLHSFAGIGPGSATIEQCYKLASRKEVAQVWRKCKFLIIDEISMVDGQFFTKMEAVARHIRKNEKVFGGIQLILCGDFLQLPPVTKAGQKRQFCFQSSVWDDCIHQTVVLQDVKRQNDDQFIEILQNIRLGKCSLMQEMVLKNTSSNVVEKGDIKATRLCTHKDDVDYINKVQLDKLYGEARMFHSLDSDPVLRDTLDRYTPVPGQLILKKGAQVMLMKNLDVNQGLVNGARGVVTGFSPSNGSPTVKFVCGIIRELTHEKWSVKSSGGNTMSRRQIPLKLAWAFSIHKSQGMTLDCVEMSLAKVFESGQAYVALSRARNLKSLRIIDFNPFCVKANADVLKFYSNFTTDESWGMKQTHLCQMFKD